MTIHRLIQNLAFDQDDIERLAAAYEESLRALHTSDRDETVQTREAVNLPLNGRAYADLVHAVAGPVLRRRRAWRSHTQCDRADGGICTEAHPRDAHCVNVRRLYAR